MDVYSSDGIKVYVKVNVCFQEDGTMLPRVVIWENGYQYKIDRVSDIRQSSAAKAGGQGDRYTVWINGRQGYLYFERNHSIIGNNIGRWFVERR